MSYEQMPRVDRIKDKETINKNLAQYMKLLEKQNLERVNRLQRIRRNNIITGLSLGACALGIYAYSIIAVKQETFLDDFNEPAVKQLD